jgi:hypothetical protein
MRRVAYVGLIALTLLLGITRPGEARVRVFIGPAWGGPVVVAPYPYEVPPRVIVSPPPPPGYVEQPPPAIPYYYENPPRYYPQVAQCPGGWKTVTPPPAG